MKHDWIVRPKGVEAKVEEWVNARSNLVKVEYTTQYTGHRVLAITISKPGQLEKKRKMLAVVPHAHEPAGTAAIMNYINKLLTGYGLNGEKAEIDTEKILSNTLLTFIPIGNPDGRDRSPEEYWDGTRYTNEEFWRIMHGSSSKPGFNDGKFWLTHPYFDIRAEAIEIPGIVYEQISKYEYAEGNRWKKTKMYDLIENLMTKYRYDQFLNLHQGMENWTEWDTWLEYPTQSWIPRSAIDYCKLWEEAVLSEFEKVGGKPNRNTGHYENFIFGPDPENPNERRKWLIDWIPMKYGSAELTVEVQNNNQNTPWQEQIILSEAAIKASVDFLLKKGHLNS